MRKITDKNYFLIISFLILLYLFKLKILEIKEMYLNQNELKAM